MLDFLKKYWLHIVATIILVLLLGVSINNYNHERTRVLKYAEAFYQGHCVGEEIVDKKSCEIYSPENRNKSFFVYLTNILETQKFPRGFLIVLLIMLPTSYILSRYLKSKKILYELNRRSFSSTKIRLYLQSLIPVIILMVVLCFAVGYCYFKTDGNFNINPISESGQSVWNSPETDTPILFLVTFLSCNLFMSILYTNIVLIIARKYKNFFILSILSFLTIIGLQLFSEIGIEFIGLLLDFDIDAGVTFNFLDMIGFNVSSGLLIKFLFGFTVFIVSSIIVYFMYRNKEKYIIYIEQLDN